MCQPLIYIVTDELSSCRVATHISFLIFVFVSQVTVEVHSPHAGVVAEIFASEGAEVNVGQPLFVVTKGGAPPAPSPAPPAKASAPAPAASPAPKTEAPKAASPKPSPSPSPALASGAVVRGETRVKMSRMRQRIAQRLKEAQNTAAMLTTFQEVDMTNLMAMRAKYKEDFEKVHGIKLGFMGAFVKVRPQPAATDGAGDMLCYCDIIII